MVHRRMITGLSLLAALLSAMGLLGGAATATETENLGMRVLPAPGKVTVDGKTDDWDLSGGIFVCGNIETRRDHYACWFHMMYDADNLYVLARWIDQTPMNNPSPAPGRHGYNGDCLQVRFIMARDRERTSHVTAWFSTTTKKHVVALEYGRLFGEGRLSDAQARGARQAFLKNEDGKGYSQEIALPWKLLTRDGPPPKAGDKFTMTLEPNFSVGWRGRSRLSIKDIFKPGGGVDRTATYQAYYCWGTAALEPKGNVEPAPLRLSDAREFAVKMRGKTPVVDWDDQIKEAEPIGYKPVELKKADAKRRLTVRSIPITGVSVIGGQPGVTNYTATCTDGQVVILSAPGYTSADGEHYDFVCWKVDDAENLHGLTTAQITMKADHTATAVYEAQPAGLTGPPIPATREDARAADAAGTTSSDDSPTAEPDGASRHDGWTVVILGLLAAAVLGLVLWRLWSRSRRAA